MKKKTHIISTSKTGKRYEDIVADIHLQFSNPSKITKNEFIMGRSGQRRQIDISLRAEISGYPILMIIECKKYNRPIDIGEIDELIGKVDDVSAAKGILASDSGFTSGAFKRAKENRHIQLISVIDTTNTQLKSKILFPVYVTYHELGEFIFSISVEDFNPLAKNKIQSNEELTSSRVSQLTEIVKSETASFLKRFGSWNNENSKNLTQGPHEYSEIIQDNEERKLIFKCNFEKSIRSYVNENIFLEIIGVYDHLEQSLIHHKELVQKEITIDEDDVVKTWRKLPDNFDFSATKNHYERVTFYSKDLLEKSAETMISQLIKKINDYYRTI